MIWQITSGVNVAGAPQRGASLRRAATLAEASAFVVEVMSRERRTPVFQRANEVVIGKLPGDLILHDEAEAEAGFGRAIATDDRRRPGEGTGRWRGRSP
ncbi:MAG: hypothetical protein ABSC06_13675 [Rhodopila sp.]|jgi:hypothetical protein